jgi:hypothetical protein
MGKNVEGSYLFVILSTPTVPDLSDGAEDNNEISQSEWQFPNRDLNPAPS